LEVGLLAPKIIYNQSMRSLHGLDHSIPLQSGFTFRTLSLLTERRR